MTDSDRIKTLNLIEQYSAKRADQRAALSQQDALEHSDKALEILREINRMLGGA